MPTNLAGMDRTAMARFFEELGEHSFRADQVTKWIHQQGVDRFDEMTNLNKQLRARLMDTSLVDIPTIVQDQRVGCSYIRTLKN